LQQDSFAQQLGKSSADVSKLAKPIPAPSKSKELLVKESNVSVEHRKYFPVDILPSAADLNRWSVKNEFK
jgi:hypothetical protein